MRPLLTLRGVSKSFAGTAVLREVDLDVFEHQVVSLIGPSGCGKSTLLRCVNALEAIDAGQIELDGELVSGPGVDVDFLRRQVGIVFQSYNLFPHMSVLDNITLAPTKVLRQSSADARARTMVILERIGLADKANSYLDHLSGGQQQRVAIARALAMGPRLLLLDEVTSALDPELVDEVLAIVQELASEGMTMIVATHEMAFARDVSDVVCFLHGGRVCESGPPEQVLDHPTNSRTQLFLRRVLGSPEQPRVLLRTDGAS
jgi:polar amino acid transport system ATP-binding protein